MDKQNVVYPYKGILFYNNIVKEKGMKCCYMHCMNIVSVKQYAKKEASHKRLHRVLYHL